MPKRTDFRVFKNANEARELAQRARKLAKSLHQADVVAELLRVATDLDKAAQEIESRVRSTHSESP